MTTISIRTELLGSPNPNRPPATSLIRLVLETAADKAEAAEYAISTRFSIVRTARQSCDQIDTTIAEIDRLPADAQETAWPKFTKYSRDIRSLEDLLLDKKGFFREVDFKPKTEPVRASLDEADNWETHRGDLKTQLDRLHQFLNDLKGGSPRTTPPAGDQQRDDAAIIHWLSNLLTQESSGLPGHASEAITELKNALSTIDPVTHKDGIIPAIKGAWVVYAAAWEGKRGSDAKQRSFMSSKAVWDAVKSFSGILRGGNAPTFQAAFNSLKDVLTVTANTATRDYIKVIRAARGVRRPFMDLNNLLVEYCSILVELHHKADPGIVVAYNTAVSDALKYALEAAEAAKGSLPGTATPWKGEVPNKDAVDAAFNKAFESLKALFGIYDPSKLNGWDEAKDKASEGDINRFEQLKATPFGNPSTNALPTGKVVTVYIKDPGGSNPRAVSIHDSTKIETLIWREGHQFIGAKEGGRPLTLGRTIAELGLSGKTIELITASGASSGNPPPQMPRPQSQQQPPMPPMPPPTDPSVSSPGNRVPQTPRAHSQQQQQQQQFLPQTSRPQSQQQQPTAPTPRMSSSEIAPPDLRQTPRPQTQQQPTAPTPRMSSSETPPPDPSTASGTSRFSRGFSMMKPSRSQLPPQAAPPSSRPRNGETTYARRPADSDSDS